MTIQYIKSLLTFYIKGEISIDDSFVNLKDPNTILSLIPLGAKKETIAIDQITSTQSNFKLKFGRLLLGIILVFIGVRLLVELNGHFGILPLLVSLILIILAVNLILGAFQVYLEIYMTSGRERFLHFWIFEKAKAAEVEQTLNAYISKRLNDTNARRQTDRIVEAIGNH